MTHRSRRRTLCIIALAVVGIVIHHQSAHAQADGHAMAPDWKLKAADGKTTNLRQFHGKPLVLVFYQGKGCLHCVEQIQSFARKAEAYKKAGVNIVGISIEDRKTLREGLQSFGKKFPFPLLTDKELDVFKAYQVYDEQKKEALHGTFLIDKGGRIRFADIGEDPFHRPDFLLAERQRFLKQPIVQWQEADSKELFVVSLHGGFRPWQPPIGNRFGRPAVIGQPQRIPLIRPMPRMNVHRMTATQRLMVGRAIWNYIDEGTIRNHRNNQQAHRLGNGDAFMNLHRAMIRHLEQYLWSVGMPLPVWSPTDPIPVEFLPVKPSGGIARPQLQNPRPRVPMPPTLQPLALRNYRTVRDLGNAIMPWHDNVHRAVGGTMQQTEIAPAALIFWAWHAYVDNMQIHWERNRNNR